MENNKSKRWIVKIYSDKIHSISTCLFACYSSHPFIAYISSAAVYGTLIVNPMEIMTPFISKVDYWHITICIFISKWNDGPLTYWWPVHDIPGGLGKIDGCWCPVSQSHQQLFHIEHKDLCLPYNVEAFQFSLISGSDRNRDKCVYAISTPLSQ